jgi:hypothetical protein
MAEVKYGTMSTLDTLRSITQTVAEYGEDRAFEDFENLRAAHNRNWADLRDTFVESTTERLRRYGASSAMAMEEVDEYGSPHAQRVRAGSNVGFPLKLYQAGLQWTRKYFQAVTVAEWSAQITSIFTADVSNLIIQMKTALFAGTNYFSTDPLVDNLGSVLGTGVQIPVKALANADGAEIPVGPNGETFNGSTHTHYLFSATLTTTALDALIKTVVEHFSGGKLIVLINQAQEATVRALTGFTAYNDVRLVGATSSPQVPSRSLDGIDIYNRSIGLYGAAEIWVKPWVPANYQVCYLEGQPRPLAMRTRPGVAGGLELVSESESHPLRARIYEREFGIGVWNRVNGAVNFSNKRIGICRAHDYGTHRLIGEDPFTVPGEPGCVEG